MLILENTADYILLYNCHLHHYNHILLHENKLLKKMVFKQVFYFCVQYNYCR